VQAIEVRCSHRAETRGASPLAVTFALQYLAIVRAGERLLRRTVDVVQSDRLLRRTIDVCAGRGRSRQELHSPAGESTEQESRLETARARVLAVGALHHATTINQRARDMHC
jgi:hypothetical protein